MKKIFISCPMNGRTAENIKKTIVKMHKYAEFMLEEECEVIPSYFPDFAKVSLSGMQKRKRH